jgi:hypothetical protein
MAAKQKYPKSKSIFARLKEKFSPPKCVYAGPEQMGSKNPASGVYAGPEYYEKTRPVGRVYAGPKPKEPDDEPVNDVYAGPEFFEREPEPDPAEPEDAPVPEETTVPEESPAPENLPEDFRKQYVPPTCMVYGGPAYFNPKPVPEAPVYAGPEYFDQRPAEGGSRAPMPEAEPSDAKEIKVYGSGTFLCESCGTRFDGPFCPNCGTPKKNGGPVIV